MPDSSAINMGYIFLGEITKTGNNQEGVIDRIFNIRPYFPLYCVWRVGKNAEFWDDKINGSEALNLCREEVIPGGGE